MANGAVPRLSRFNAVRPLLRLTEDMEFISLWRWMRLSLLVGAIVGLGAAGLKLALDQADTLLAPVAANDRSWMWILVLLVPALGGLVAGLITQLAPEARGAGTDSLIEAFHTKRGNVRARVIPVRALATLFTLGSGGSGGREGPMAQIGAAIGSTLANRLGLSKRERRLLLLAGAAGGVSALFRTPLGAALWALEVPYREDFEGDGIFSCLVASVTSYSIVTLIFGQGSLFSVPSEGYAFLPEQLPLYIVVGLVCAIAGALWIKFDGASRRVWNELTVPGWLKPAIGGLLLGVLALGVPWVFGSGYLWIQDTLRPPADDARLLPIGHTGAALLMALAFAKMIATSLTIRSGGSAGMFAPALFIGGFVGGSLGLLFHEWAPSVIPAPGACVLVGMGAFYAGLARTPISTIILISELFGSYDLLVPLMLAEMITVAALRNVTLFPSQVDHAYDSPAHESDVVVDVLESLRVQNCYTPGRGADMISASMTIREFLEHVAESAESYFVVGDSDGSPVGTVSLSNVRAVVMELDFLDAAVVADAMWPLLSVAPEDDLNEALKRFLDSGYDHMPVIAVSNPKTILGMLSQQQVFAAYNAELMRRRFSDEEQDTEDERQEVDPVGKSDP